MTTFHKLLLSSATFSAWMLAAVSAEAQSVVFHNIAPYDPGSLTSTNFIGASLIMGNQALDFDYLIFPQQNGTVDEYDPDEQFSIAARNPDGTVGTTLYDYTHFTLTNNSSNGQTTASLENSQTPVLLLPATGYWFILYYANSDPLYAEWAFTTSTTYRSSDGITIPADDAAYAQNVGDDPGYYSLAEGPQMLNLFATPTVVPEPSTSALVLASLGLIGLAARFRRLSHVF